MNERTLRIPSRKPKLSNLSSSEFTWRPTPGETSFATKLGPKLAAIGEVPMPNADFLSLAVAAFLADRTIKRPSRGWERDIAIRLPVFDDAVWTTLTPKAEFVLRLLTGDNWQVKFEPRKATPSKKATPRADVDRVVLLSGGADSLCGAVRALEQGDRVLLVSHWDWTGHAKFQSDLARRLDDRYPGKVTLRQHQLSRRARQVGSGVPFGNEPTRRVRSLLFVALGLAHARLSRYSPCGFQKTDTPRSTRRWQASAEALSQPARRTQRCSTASEKS